MYQYQNQTGMAQSAVVACISEKSANKPSQQAHTNRYLSRYARVLHVFFINCQSQLQFPLEHSNSGKKSFDSILATESILSIRFDSPIW